MVACLPIPLEVPYLSYQFSVTGHLGYFQYYGVKDKAMMKVLAVKSLHISVIITLGQSSRIGITGQKRNTSYQ